MSGPLRVLPPGGGDGDGPDGPDDDAGVFRNERAAAAAERQLELAERLTTRQRRFAEHFALHGNVNEALYHAIPDALQRTRKTQLEYIGNLLSIPAIREYVDMLRGSSGLYIGFTFAAVMLVQWDIATDEKNSPFVRQLAASQLANLMLSSGIAAAEGFAKPDKKALSKGDDRPPGPITDQDVEELEGILFGEEAG